MSIREILRFHCATDTSSFQQFDNLIREHERRTGKDVDDDVDIGITMSNMNDVDPSSHILLQAERLTTSAELRCEVTDVFRTEAAKGPFPMHDGHLVECRTRGCEWMVTRGDTFWLLSQCAVKNGSEKPNVVATVDGEPKPATDRDVKPDPSIHVEHLSSNLTEVGSCLGACPFPGLVLDTVLPERLLTGHTIQSSELRTRSW